MIKPIKAYAVLGYENKIATHGRKFREDNPPIFGRQHLSISYDLKTAILANGGKKKGIIKVLIKQIK